MYVKEEENKALQMLLDCKTRWNSVETMLACFLRIYEPCKLALTEMNLRDHILDDQEVALLTSLLNAMQPIKLSVKQLSRGDCDVLKLKVCTLIIITIGSSSIYFFNSLFSMYNI